MNIQRLVLAKKQLDSTLPEKENTTLYTDETSKGGHRYGGFALSDSDGNYALLGLREMSTKSAQDTLSTFKDILQDISESQEHSENDTSLKILRNIQNTMSDRASTELKFNDLLQDYRKDILPIVIDNFDQLDDKTRTSVERLNNFFCGLHGLIHLATAAQTALLETEKGNFDDNTPTSDPNFNNGNESGCFRLIRTSCKAFARRGDEKNGCYGPFRTFIQPFLDEHSLSTLPLEPMLGNRFNITFYNAGIIYFLHRKMIEFLESVSVDNRRLLKSVLFDMKTSFFVAGLKALGLVSKFITSPLWNLLESRAVSITEMNNHYLQLSTFLADASENVELFMKGEMTLYANFLANKDQVYNALIADSEYDDDVHVILRVLLPALKKVVCHVYKDHLPGGRYETVDDVTAEQSQSTEKHNAYVERLFGYLDQILRAKPNISTLASEAYAMFLMNKTGQWLSQQNQVDIIEMLADARHKVSKERSLFKSRKEEIMQDRRQKQEEEFLKKEKSRQRKMASIEKQSDDIIRYGLWKTKQECRAKLREQTTVKEKTLAVKSQLRYRKNILKQQADKCLFLFTKKADNGKRLPLKLQDLTNNLIELLK